MYYHNLDMSFYSVVTLFGGLALFLYGMRLMSSGLKESSTGTLKNIMTTVTNNPFTSFLLGLFVTALIQSSTATIVITSGLVAAGIISLHQSLGIIIGANVGTTVTGQIIRLMDVNESSTAWLQLFKPATLAPVALIAGIVLIMFVKARKSDTIGTIFMGFGILFTGLMNMTNAVSVLNESGVFNNLFEYLTVSPFIGYLIGATVAFILQSSSATIGILQAFSVAGGLYFKSIYAVIVGVYLGDCVTTAIVCSIGAKPEAKRVGTVNILYNLCKSVLVMVGVFVAHKAGLLNNIWDMRANSGVIANTNSIFNIACSLILLPFVSRLENLSKKIVKDEPVKQSKYQSKIDGLNPNFYSTPALAFSSAYDVLLLNLSLARENIAKAYSLFENYDEKILADIEEEEENIDMLTDRVNAYLLSMTKYINLEEHMVLESEYVNILIEFERLGDHAVNITEAATGLKERGLEFSSLAREELKILYELIQQIMDLAAKAFTDRDDGAAGKIEPLEEVVDDLVAALKENHINRLNEGLCNVYSGTIFLNLLQDFERISDICSNIGIATIIRVHPELADRSHNYLSSLHQGFYEDYNSEYHKAHDRYFRLLDEVEKKNK